MSSLTQKVAILAVVFVVAFGLLVYAIYDKYEAFAETEKEIEQLDDKIVIYNKQIATLQDKTTHKDNIEKVFKDLVEILPQESPRQKDKILDWVNAYCVDSKVIFDGIYVPQVGKVEDTGRGGGVPAAAAAAAAKKEKQFGEAFEQTEITVKLKGTFVNFLKFLNRLETNSSFVRVDEMKLDPLPPDDKEPRMLAIVVKLSTFHYVIRER